MRKTLFLAALMVVLILNACGRDDSGNEKGEIPPKAAQPITFDPTIAQLVDTIGNPAIRKNSDMLSHDPALKAADDYKPGTGRWFEEENGFNLIASISGGENEGGSSVGAALSLVPENRTVRFQLTSRTANGQRAELLSEYIEERGDPVYGRADYSVKLPLDPNVNYLISIEVLAADGMVEDTLLRPLYVPFNELNAKLTIDAPSVNTEETKLYLYNAGPTNLFFGKGYALYRKEADGWKAVPDNRDVESIGIHLEPGGTYEERVVFPANLQAGQYRLVKEIDGFMTTLTVPLAADFELQ